jgi:hypothetical protein
VIRHLIERGPLWLSLAAAILYAPLARRACNRGHHWHSILAHREIDSYIGEVFLWRRCFWCRSLNVEPVTRYAPEEPALRPATRTPA